MNKFYVPEDSEQGFWVKLGLSSTKTKVLDKNGFLLAEKLDLVERIKFLRVKQKHLTRAEISCIITQVIQDGEEIVCLRI